MKSILVDALRQADGDDADQALTDSGSFGTSQDALDAPANDVIEEDQGELELMSTTNALVIRDESQDASDEPVAVDEDQGEPQDFAVEYEPVEDDHAMTVAGMIPLPVTKRQSPRLAMLTPFLCAALAFAVAASWLLINKLTVRGTSLGTTISNAHAADPADAAAIELEPATRFPFLTSGQPDDAEGSMQ